MASLPISRREYLKLATAGVLGTSMSGWLQAMADDTAKDPQRKKACILLWMTGGPSQMDTFDLKPGHANGGPFKEIQTSAPGLKISEHLPRIARFGDKMAVIRGMSTKEGEHTRATFLLRNGYQPTGPIQYPSIGSLVSKELGSDAAALPNYVAIAPYRQFNPAAYAPGFLGPAYAPLIVGDNGIVQLPGVPGRGQPQQQEPPADAYERQLKVEDVDLPRGVEKAHSDARMDLLEEMERDFVRKHPGVAPASHQTAYDRAVKLMKTAAAKAFDLNNEKDDLRDRYGRNLFGQGCLLARRLVEHGVPFVEVGLTATGGNGSFSWDTHGQNFDNVKTLSGILDPAWATLMTDLKERGLLDSTLIVWMGEFGRTPKINPQQGRDHFPNAWSTVLAGGGIKGGQAIGKTSPDGMEVADRPVSVGDFIATVATALGMDPRKQHTSNVGRPIRIAEPNAKPIQEVLS
jgi:Protein of unknown function (DUF1501)